MIGKKSDPGESDWILNLDLSELDWVLVQCSGKVAVMQ